MTVNTNHNVPFAPADFRPELWERWVALRNGSLAQIEEIVSPALALHVPGRAGAPAGPGVPLVPGVPGGRARAGGRRALASWLSSMRAALPSGRFAVQVGPIINGDLIAGRWVLCREDGPPEEAAFTGTDILRVEAGQVIELWINHDALDRVLIAGRVAA